MYQRIKNSILKPREIAKYANDRFIVIFLYLVIFGILIAVNGITEIKHYGSNLSNLFVEEYRVRDYSTKEVNYYIFGGKLFKHKDAKTSYILFNEDSVLKEFCIIIGDDLKYYRFYRLYESFTVFQCLEDGIYFLMPTNGEPSKFKITDYTVDELDLRGLATHDFETASRFFNVVKVLFNRNIGMIYAIAIPSLIISGVIEVLYMVFMFALIGFIVNKKFGLRFGKSFKIGILCSVPMVLGYLFNGFIGNNFFGILLYYVGFFATIYYYIVASRQYLVSLHSNKEEEEEENESI